MLSQGGHVPFRFLGWLSIPLWHSTSFLKVTELKFRLIQLNFTAYVDFMWLNYLPLLSQNCDC